MSHGTPVVQSSSAAVPVIVGSNGDSANFSGTLYWGATDGGTEAAFWQHSVTLGSGLANGATINAVIGQLAPGITYYYRAKGTNFAGDAWAASSGSFVPPVASLPSISGAAPTLIGTRSAQLNGQVVSTGGDTPAVTAWWGQTDGNTVPAAWQYSAVLGKQGGTFIHTPADLATGTTYYFRFSATNTAGTVWSGVTQTFTTIAVSAPGLLLVPAIGETANTALFNGAVTNLGNEAPAVTIFWGPSNGGTNPAAWANTQALAGTQSGAFGHLATNLTASTPCYWTARAVNAGGTSWGQVQTFSTNTKPPVFINEVHYDPDDHTKRLEFIELWNPSTTPVNLSGWQFTGPVDYVFPANTTLAAGSYLVVAENPAQLNTAYSVAGALGPWTGELKNSGGHIVLRNSAGTQVDDVDYQRGFPWPSRSAGGGASMELINPGLENDIGGSWRSSTALPTPGRVNGNYSNVAPPAVSQVAYAAVATPAQGEIVKSGQDVKVTAKVDDRNGVGGVTLQYQIVDPGAYIPLYLQTTATPALRRIPPLRRASRP